MANQRQLAHLVTQLLKGLSVADITPVKRSANRPSNVYQVTLTNGQRCAVKRPSESQPASLARNAIATEASVLQGLSALGCNTPEVVAFDTSAGLLATNWLDGPTLEDQLSSKGPTSVDIETVLREFFAIETSLDTARKRIDRSKRQTARTALIRETENIFKMVRSAGHRIAIDSGRSPPLVEAAAIGLQRQVCAGTWTIGPRDYNASNILLTANGPYFIDFSTIGADWPQRRIVGYTMATGAFLDCGNFVTALDNHAGLVCDELGTAVWTEQAAGALLDAHFLIAVLYSFGRLLRAISHPTDRESKQLLEAWPNPTQRLTRLRNLVDLRLYDNPTADQLRSALG